MHRSFPGPPCGPVRDERLAVVPDYARPEREMIDQPEKFSIVLQQEGKARERGRELEQEVVETPAAHA
eukprot:2655044-Rhodomonas_salina.1